MRTCAVESRSLGRFAAAALATLLLSAEPALAMRPHACAPRPMNQVDARALVAQFQTLPPLMIGAPQVFVCRFVPAYGCDDVAQVDLPLKVRAAARFNFVYGYPSFFRNRHWFYEHLAPLTLTSAGVLRSDDGKRRGYVSGRGGHVIALLTRARPVDPADRDPVLVTFGDHFEVVTDAFSCVPRTTQSLEDVR